MWQGVVRVASVGELTDTVFMKRCLDSFYQALALISDLQIVANLFRENVISIHPAATDTDNSRFLFWSEFLQMHLEKLQPKWYAACQSMIRPISRA